MSRDRAGFSRIYLASIIVLFVVAPLTSIAIEAAVGSHASGWALVAKWYTFFAAGVRLLLAGIRQQLQPGFTAAEIFGITDSSSHPLVREIGMANVSMGLLGMASLALPDWRLAAALVAALYYGQAAVVHVGHRPATVNEAVALVSDVLICLLFAAILLHAALA